MVLNSCFFDTTIMTSVHQSIKWHELKVVHESLLTRLSKRPWTAIGSAFPLPNAAHLASINISTILLFTLLQHFQFSRAEFIIFYILLPSALAFLLYFLKTFFIVMARTSRTVPQKLERGRYFFDSPIQGKPKVPPTVEQCNPTKLDTYMIVFLSKTPYYTTLFWACVSVHQHGDRYE